jgi:hypothetical protein
MESYIKHDNIRASTYKDRMTVHVHTRPETRVVSMHFENKEQGRRASLNLENDLDNTYIYVDDLQIALDLKATLERIIEHLGDL